MTFRSQSIKPEHSALRTVSMGRQCTNMAAPTSELSRTQLSMGRLGRRGVAATGNSPRDTGLAQCVVMGLGCISA